MNDEIKEILSLLNSSSWSNEAKQIEDYITNLQQENQEMKTNTIPTLKHNIDALIDEVDELEDYKSRCEKINNILNEFPDFNYSNDYIILKRKIEEALQGSDDNEYR